MAETIAAWNVFTANTLIKSSEVNANFDLFRGSHIPIDPSTGAGANRGYNIGSTEYWWLSSFQQTINLGLTSTAVATLTANTIGGTSLNVPTSAQFDVLVNGSTVGAFSSNGIYGFNETPMEFTTTAARGQFARSATLSVAGNGTTYVTIGALNITTRGRPVKFGIMSASSDAAGGGYMYHLVTTTAAGTGIKFRFVVDGGEHSAVFHVTEGVPAAGHSLHFAPSAFYVYASLAAGSHSVRIDFRNIHSQNTTTADTVWMYAYEIGGP